MRKLPGRMAALAGGEESNSRSLTGTTAAATSAQLTCQTTTMTPDSGGRSGASTETSSTQCNVSETHRHTG